MMSLDLVPPVPNSRNRKTWKNPVELLNFEVKLLESSKANKPTLVVVAVDSTSIRQLGEPS